MAACRLLCIEKLDVPSSAKVRLLLFGSLGEACGRPPWAWARRSARRSWREGSRRRVRQKNSPVSDRHGAPTLCNEKAALKGRLSACRAVYLEAVSGSRVSHFFLPCGCVGELAYGFAPLFLPIAHSTGGGLFVSVLAFYEAARPCLSSRGWSVLVWSSILTRRGYAWQAHVLRKILYGVLQSCARAAATKSTEIQD